MRNFFALGVLTTFLLVGCANTREEAGEASREVGAAANQDRIEYQRRMEARLDDMDRKIEEMKREASQATGAAKQKWDREVAELEDERREARAKYNEMRNSADAQWENFKDGVSNAVDKLEAGYNRTLEAMKTGGR